MCDNGLKPQRPTLCNPHRVARHVHSSHASMHHSKQPCALSELWQDCTSRQRHVAKECNSRKGGQAASPLRCEHRKLHPLATVVLTPVLHTSPSGIWLCPAQFSACSGASPAARQSAAVTVTPVQTQLTCQREQRQQGTNGRQQQKEEGPVLKAPAAQRKTRNTLS